MSPKPCRDGTRVLKRPQTLIRGGSWWKPSMNIKCKSRAFIMRQTIMCYLFLNKKCRIKTERVSMLCKENLTRSSNVTIEMSESVFKDGFVLHCACLVASNARDAFTIRRMRRSVSECLQPVRIKAPHPPVLLRVEFHCLSASE